MADRNSAVNKDASEILNGFAYGKPTDASFRFPQGSGPGHVHAYTRKDAFSATGLKREVKCWARYSYYGLNQHLEESNILDGTPETWPSEIPQKDVPEILSLQHRQSVRLELRSVAGVPGVTKLREDLTKLGLFENKQYKLFDMELSPTCGNIQFSSPFFYKLFLRIAADYTIHDKTNKAGWKIHSFDGLFPYLNHEVFIKAFCIEGLRLPRSGPPVAKKNQSTFDITTNWVMMEEISDALEALNKYTTDTLLPYYKENFRRYQQGLELDAEIPCLSEKFSIRSQSNWLREYSQRDFTAHAYRKAVHFNQDWNTVPRDKIFGDKANTSAAEILGIYYDVTKAIKLKSLSGSTNEDSLRGTIDSSRKLEDFKKKNSNLFTTNQQSFKTEREAELQFERSRSTLTYSKVIEASPLAFSTKLGNREAIKVSPYPLSTETDASSVEISSKLSTTNHQSFKTEETELQFEGSRSTLSRSKVIEARSNAIRTKLRNDEAIEVNPYPLNTEPNAGSDKISSKLPTTNQQSFKTQNTELQLGKSRSMLTCPKIIEASFNPFSTKPGNREAFKASPYPLSTEAIAGSVNSFRADFDKNTNHELEENKKRKQKQLKLSISPFNEVVKSVQA